MSKNAKMCDRVTIFLCEHRDEVDGMLSDFQDKLLHKYGSFKIKGIEIKDRQKYTADYLISFHYSYPMKCDTIESQQTMTEN